MESYLPLFKAIHIISFVAWFGGLFYLVRIFVYHSEAFNRSEGEQSILIPQYKLMQARVYRMICNPGMMLTWTFGMIMLFVYGIEWLKVNPWMHVKLTCILLLTVYHLYCKIIMKKLANDQPVLSAERFRLFNEIPTLFLVFIVVLAVYKNTLNYALAFTGILIFGFSLFIIMRIYKKIRLSNKT